MYSAIYMAGTYQTIPGYTAFGSNVYLAGSSHTYYKGDGTSGYLRGSSTSVRLRGSEYTSPLFVPSSSGSYKKVSVFSSSLYYDGGSNTYYDGTGQYVNGRGSSVSVTPIGSEPNVTLYYRDSDKDTGFTSIGDKCTFNLATFTTRNATVLTV